MRAAMLAITFALWAAATGPAVATVPEPGTLLLVTTALATFGAAGCVLRRRRAG
jgi:hypothetical protein